MKKLNKKGFTLIELLVVIVILLVIMSIAIPSISSSVERSKEKEKQEKIKLIESAAELYGDQGNVNIEPQNIIIHIDELYCAGLLTQEEAEDPFNKGYTLSGCVEYTKENGYNWIEIPYDEYNTSYEYCESHSNGTDNSYCRCNCNRGRSCIRQIVDDFRPYDYCPR